MFNIEDNKKYYLYERSRSSSIEFDNLEQLILYFQNNTYEDPWYTKHRYNRILDNYGVTFNDYTVEHKYIYSDDEYRTVNIIKIITPKEYVVYDSDGKFINMFNYKNQIFDNTYHEYLKHKYPNKRFKRNYRWGNYDHPYKFREEPVPHSGGSSIKRRHKFHRSSCMNELKQSQEYPEYNRKKHLEYFKISSYYYWDYDLARNKPIKCWKNQSKKRCQWM